GHAPVGAGELPRQGPHHAGVRKTHSAGCRRPKPGQAWKGIWFYRDAVRFCACGQPVVGVIWVSLEISFLFSVDGSDTIHKTRKKPGDFEFFLIFWKNP